MKTKDSRSQMKHETEPSISDGAPVDSDYDELERANNRRIGRRDMLAVWLLMRQREGRKSVHFDEPQLAALVRLCVEADEEVLRAIGGMVNGIRNKTGEQE